MWYKQKNQKDEAFPTKDIETGEVAVQSRPICIYCRKGYLEPVTVNFHGKPKIMLRCSKCGETANYGKSPKPVPVGNTDFDRDPSMNQRKNPFAR
jgi:hypothetical protein